jgi:hypothetical protein
MGQGQSTGTNKDGAGGEGGEDGDRRDYYELLGVERDASDEECVHQLPQQY